MTSKPTIGIIGAGRLGTVLARAFHHADYDTAIINSRGAGSLALQLSVLLPGVAARELPDLTEWAEVIVLAVPLPRYGEIPADLLAGKIVIDAMNYWAPVDGRLSEFDDYAGSSSGLVADSLPGARVVKAFNSIAYGELEEQALPAGSPDRRAIPFAGNDAAAKQVVSSLIDAIGFDPVDVGPLERGALFQPDTQLFNTRLTAAEIERLI